MTTELLASSWLGAKTVSGGTAGWIAVAACAVSVFPAGIRWLRVAQREHYLPGSVSRFALRWWTSRPTGMVIGTLGVGCAIAAVWYPLLAIGSAVAASIGPIGLSLKGRTSKLVWTRRLIRLAVMSLVLEAAIVAVLGVLLRVPVVAGLSVLALPRIVDVGCLFNSPIEKRLLRPHVERAKERLRLVSPRVVAVTGSFGKTSTKQAIAHMLSGSVSVQASPASYNNLAGLARSVNEQLSQGTEVFIAEMGTYGSGEIRELCEWLKPEVSVITAIGPVHLERFGSEDRVLEAKSEIVADCAVAVLATDDPRLARLADQLSSEGRAVIRCATRRREASSADAAADVVVERLGGNSGTLSVSVGGTEVRTGIRSDARESNLACALGAVIALGVSPEQAAARIETIPSTAHRLEPVKGSGGATILDDTYNSNPKGAAVAVSVLAELGSASHRRVVVTPGMVELGHKQHEENAAFAKNVATVATDLLVVGHTNKRALLEGSREGDNGSGSTTVTEVATREEAVEWVRSNTGPGDVVLYENDLPDHYP